MTTGIDFLLSLKALSLVLIFFVGLAAVCLSNLRGCDSFEAALNGNRRAGWKSAGWYCCVLLSAGVSAGALTCAIDLLRRS